MKFAKQVEEINYNLLEFGNCCYNKYCGELTLKDLFTLESVVLTARRCASGFMRKNDTCFFMQALYENSLHLRDKVLSGKFKPRYYRETIIKERGKERVIVPPCFETKVVQKVICDYLIRPLFEPKMITTNYASIAGRGTDKAYNDVAKALNKALLQPDWKDYFVVTTDFSSYFQSINVDLAFKEFSKYIKSEEVLKLMRLFFSEKHGFSLGNEISQIPASWYPSKIDHYFKDRLQRSYFRYMDDILFITKAENLEQDIATIFRLTEELGLVLKQEKVKVFSLGEQLKWCKENFFFNKKKRKYYKVLNLKRLSTEKRKLTAMERKLDGGEISKDEVEQQYRTVFNSLFNHGNSYEICQELNNFHDKLFVK